MKPVDELTYDALKDLAGETIVHAGQRYRVAKDSVRVFLFPVGGSPGEVKLFEAPPKDLPQNTPGPVLLSKDELLRTRRKRTFFPGLH
jgi:hypothetical protein